MPLPSLPAQKIPKEIRSNGENPASGGRPGFVLMRIEIDFLEDFLGKVGRIHAVSNIAVCQTIHRFPIALHQFNQRFLVSVADGQKNCLVVPHPWFLDLLGRAQGFSSQFPEAILFIGRQGVEHVEIVVD